MKYIGKYLSVEIFFTCECRTLFSREEMITYLNVLIQIFVIFTGEKFIITS
jgi:hypothetical protein